ncbi:alpha/beta hydrolase [Pseudonocardia kujensis]|uniref:alpha/beta hydrolase n=1 Tax=Pseudonocardia kujensis TaxID=1128675 RepID=UPI001E45870D|nr:alpha/beta fold hydrolase [Pseudonocardia kujensis]MCE0764840.1 alpha/beta hydrolase [Pseudonocardia kujensis]
MTMMATTTVQVRTTAGPVTGRGAGPAARDTPLVVALHGGGHHSGYFDVPGHSLLDVGAAAGFEVVALDRPGYGGSHPPAGELTFARSAEVVDEAIGALWRERGGARPGVVVVSHSIGSAIAVHLAARRPQWPLLGLSLHGVGDRSPAHVIDAWRAVPPGAGPVELPAPQRRALLYGPAGTVDDDAVDAARTSVAPLPLAEMLEIVDGWPAEHGKVAAEVVVPVHYTLAEYDGLWVVDEDRLAAFAQAFSSAPWVTARIQRGAGHNLDHHRLSRAFHLGQLAFAAECAARR